MACGRNEVESEISTVDRTFTTGKCLNNIRSLEDPKKQHILYNGGFIELQEQMDQIK